MANPSELCEKFSSLGPNEKAMFLARVAHEATIYAREAYISSRENPERSYDSPDPIILRDANNFVHRVTGYMVHVLDSSEMEGQDESVVMMIVAYFQERRADRHLYEWLGPSKK